MSSEEINKFEFDEVLSLKTKLSFSIFQFGNTIFRQMFLITLLIFYREELLLTEIYIIIAFALYAIWNAINDPLFGWLSDKTSTRWGRRRPYLWIFTPILSISFILIWLSPSTNEIGQIGVFFWMLFAMLLFDTALTANHIVWSAMLPELSMNNTERSKLSIYSTIFAMLGAIPVMFLPDIFLNAGREGVFLIAIILALIQLGSMGITCLFVKEKLVFSRDEPLGLIDSFKYTIKRKSFLTTTSMGFLATFNNAVFYGVIFFYLYYVHPGLETGVLLLFAMLLVIIGLIIGILYSLRVLVNSGVKKAIINSLLFYAIGFFMIGLLPGILGIIGFFFVGLGIFGSQSLQGPALANVADEDEIQTGSRREAAIFGTHALINKPAESAAGAFIAFMLLVFKYQQPINGVQQAQSDFTILGFLLTLGIVPGIFAILAIIVFRKYPLDGLYLEEIRTKMNKLHKDKMERFLSKSYTLKKT
jgi:GPH family glycoside/pentoside/hexuronide:cation symporter